MASISVRSLTIAMTASCAASMTANSVWAFLKLIFSVHDIGRVTHADRHEFHWNALTKGGGFRALTELRAAGIKGFGLGVNEWQIIRDALEEADLDCSLLAGRYSLLDQVSEKNFCRWRKSVAWRW